MCSNSTGFCKFCELQHAGRGVTTSHYRQEAAGRIESEMGCANRSEFFTGRPHPAIAPMSMYGLDIRERL